MSFLPLNMTYSFLWNVGHNIQGKKNSVFGDTVVRYEERETLHSSMNRSCWFLLSLCPWAVNSSKNFSVPSPPLGATGWLEGASVGYFLFPAWKAGRDEIGYFPFISWFGSYEE